MTDCPGSRHGTSSYCYFRFGCRCPDTVTFVRAMTARWRRDRRDRLGQPQPLVEPVDEIAVARALHGDRVPLTPKERGLVIATLTRRGLSAAQIGRQIGISQRQVVRYRGGKVARAREAA